MLLEKIRALAMEKLASEEEVNAFMEGFEKVAFGPGFMGELGQAMTRADVIGKAGVGLAASLLGAAVVKGVSVANKFADESKLRGQFETALMQIKGSNRALKGVKPEKIDNFAHTIFKFAPHVASDPNLLGYVLGNVVQGDESIDVNTIKMLVDLESRYIENHRTQPLVGIKH